MRGRGSHRLASAVIRFPGGLVALAPAPQRAPPVPDHAIPEEARALGYWPARRDRRSSPSRHVSANCPAPRSAHADPSPQVSLISRSLARKRSRRDFRRSWKRPFRERPQMWVKPRKLNVSGLPRPRPLRFVAAWRPNSIRRVLSGCRCNAKSARRSRQSVQEPLGIVPVLEADDNIIGIAHDDHVAGGVASSPAFGPQIEDVVQIDVRQQW